MIAGRLHATPVPLPGYPDPVTNPNEPAIKLAPWPGLEPAARQAVQSAIDHASSHGGRAPRKPTRPQPPVQACTHAVMAPAADRVRAPSGRSNSGSSSDRNRPIALVATSDSDVLVADNAESRPS
jgi:hypothetical protein